MIGGRKRHRTPRPIMLHQHQSLWKFESEITLCCKSLKTQAKFRGWLSGTISATGL
jgi:hypothetical protein